jgi:uncharacterized protein DUF1569
MPERRTLDFECVDQIMPDVERLLDGHSTAGCWTLGQICDHLARGITLTLRKPRGDATAPEPTREQEANRRLFLRARSFPEGIALPSRLLEPATDLDPRDAADALRSALDRLSSHDGPLPAHPYLGPLTRDEWVDFHCIHCAHHLSFVVLA